MSIFASSDYQPGAGSNHDDRRSRGHLRTHRDDTDHSPRKCPIYKEIGIECVPVPNHMQDYGSVLVDSMQRGQLPQEPTYLVSVRPTEQFTLERAHIIERGSAVHLMQDCKAILDNKGRPVPGAVHLLKDITGWFRLSDSQSWDLWGYTGVGNGHKRKELKNMRDVYSFVRTRLRKLNLEQEEKQKRNERKERMEKEKGGKKEEMKEEKKDETEENKEKEGEKDEKEKGTYETSDGDLKKPLGEQTERVERCKQMLMYFVVETGASWPKTFDVAYDAVVYEDELIHERIKYGKDLEKNVVRAFREEKRKRRTEQFHEASGEVVKTFDEWRQDDKNKPMTNEEWKAYERKEQERVKEEKRGQENKGDYKHKESTDRGKSHSDRLREQRKREERMREERKREEKKRKEMKKLEPAERKVKEKDPERAKLAARFDRLRS